MVRFNELRIDENSKKLIIDISVRILPYYKDVYLESIIIDTQDTFIDSFPSSKAVYSKKIDVDGGGNESFIKDYRIELSNADILPSFNNNLFFVYIKTKGNPTANTPCGLDEEITVGVVFNECLIYNKLLSHIREIGERCTIPQNFINDYLQYEAFCIAINSGHFVEGIKYYKKFIQNNMVRFNKLKGCGC